MNFYSMLKFLFKKVLDKNRILLDQPIADHCFRIGTGASVKNIDFGKINSPSILINQAYLHKHANLLDIDAIVMPEPFISSPFLKKHYSKKWIKNLKRKFLQNTLNDLPENINFITSITNYPFIKKRKNNYFVFHFGRRNCSLDALNITSDFSFMRGGLYMAIGYALNRGYKKVTLLGCDYLIKAASEPIMGGHFYINIPVYVMKFSNTYEDLLNEIDGKIDISSYTTYKTAKCFCATSPFEKYQYLLNKKSTPPFAKEDYVNELAGIHHYHN